MKVPVMHVSLKCANKINNTENNANKYLMKMNGFNLIHAFFQIRLRVQHIFGSNITRREKVGKTIMKSLAKCSRHMTQPREAKPQKHLRSSSYYEDGWIIVMIFPNLDCMA